MPAFVRSVARYLLIATSCLLLVVMAEQPSLSRPADVRLLAPTYTLLSQADEQRLEAERLFQQGSQQYQRGQYSEAIASWQQALEIYRASGDFVGESVALNYLGITYSALGQYTQALDYYGQALEIAGEIGDRQREAGALSNLGNIYRSLGQYPQAIDAISQTLTIFQDIGDRQGEANALNNLGLVYGSLGQYRQATEARAQALAIFQEIGDRQGEANALSNLGSVYYSLGQYPEAIEAHSQALAIFQEIGDSQGEARVLGNLGSVYGFLGQSPQAIEAYMQALRIFQEIGNRVDEQAALTNLGNTYYSLGQYEQAVDYFEQAIAIARTIGDHASEQVDLNNLGNAYRSLGQNEQAIAYYEQALSIILEIGDRAGESRALINLGDAYSSLREYDQAANFYNRALAIAQDIVDRSAEAMSLNGLSVAYQALEQPSKAEAALDQASKLIWDLLGEETISLDNLRSLLSSREQSQRLLPEILIAQGKPIEALRVSEESRHMNWLLMTPMPTRHQPDSIFQYVQKSASVSISELQQISAEQNATLVEYTVVTENLLIWVIQPDGTIAHRASSLSSLEHPLEELTALFPKLTGNSSGRVDEDPNVEEIDQALESLYNLLIAPIADILPESDLDRVIFIPHRDLFRVPLAALRNPENDQYLIENHTIFTAPSIQALSLTRELRNRVSTSTGALVVGNPNLPNNIAEGFKWRSLPGAESEAKQIAHRLGSEPLIGAQATEATVASRLHQSRYIHLAAHGTIPDNISPTLETAISGFWATGEPIFIPQAQTIYGRFPGFVALTPSQTKDENFVGRDALTDGFLTSLDILTLDDPGNPINAELVVLSGCQTGAQSVGSDGVTGLSDALILAGAPSVVVSLWGTSDAYTRDLMVDFYDNLLSEEYAGDKAQALRQAMLTMLDQGILNPEYWAAFTLIGQPE